MLVGLVRRASPGRVLSLARLSSSPATAALASLAPRAPLPFKSPFVAPSGRSLSTSSTRMMASLTDFVLPADTPIYRLESREAFGALEARDKNYAYHIAQASWHGSLSVLATTSPESPFIFRLLVALFEHETPAELAASALKAGVAQAEIDALLMYTAGFFSNMGNYKSFGDTKFVPGCSVETLEQILKASRAWNDASDLGVRPDGPMSFSALFAHVRGPMYSLSKREQQLGLGADVGVTSYYSYDMTKETVKAVQDFMDAKGISPYNTRLFRRPADGVLELRLASAQRGKEGDKAFEWLGRHQHEGSTVEVVRGDHAPYMAAAAKALMTAKTFASNEHQSSMLGLYAKSFDEGSMEAHIDASRSWIRDRGPIVESYIGFIESYRDPYGVRGEWEGFVAIVNKETSLRYQRLVEMAEKVISRLPWPAAFEKDTFLRPDFTSLEIVSYAGSGVPAGINIPNYDVIRQTEGFKNVSLGNVLRARSGNKDTPFIAAEDQAIYLDKQTASFQVQVALHELLGHGSGKLLQQSADGAFNFSRDLIDPTTGQPVSSFYRSTETWDTKFAGFSSAYEECRAEAVGVYLCLEKDVLEMFGATTEADQADLVYVNWLSMARAGLMGLEYYTPETATWRQAHMQARYVILRVMMEAGQGLVTIEKCKGAKGGDSCLVRLDRSKIESVARPAVGKFLQMLQVLKSTGDVERAKVFFGGYSKVPEEMMAWRPIVLANKPPRPIYNMTVLRKNGEDVTAHDTDNTPAGVIEAYVERFAPVAKLVQVPKEEEALFVL